VSGLPLDPVDDVERVASRAAGRSLAVEGIPMVLGLEDVTGPSPAPAPSPAGTGADEIGAELADRLRVYRAVLFPAADGDDYWAVHDALVAVSDAHAPRPVPPT
jgi:hypothetical protein